MVFVREGVYSLVVELEVYPQVHHFSRLCVNRANSADEGYTMLLEAPGKACKCKFVLCMQLSLGCISL